MKFPTPLILQTSSSLLLPNPLILKHVFGVDFDSTEGLLRWLHKVTESDVPVDNKTLNRGANGGGKWSTKQKIAQPLTLHDWHKYAWLCGWKVFFYCITAVYWFLKLRKPTFGSIQIA